MIFAPKSLEDLLNAPFDAVIDVRSPAEFAEDHPPGAVNLPVLNNEERARVGTLYKQVSPFDARKLGAALVFANASHHVQAALSGYDGSWRPLVYCWRGGQRSGAFTWMLREIGWRAEVLDGGYRSFRRLVKGCLYDNVLPFKIIQLGGYTGTAKTALLARLAHRGVQTLDLEGLANHRGSLLGRMAEAQPSQKAFETALAKALLALSPAQPVVVEAESSKIGDINLPPALWEAMKAAPWIEVTAPLEARARFLAEAYEDVLADHAALCTKLAPLRFHRGHALLDRWAELSAAGEKIALCASLAADHYDPAYDKAKKSVAPRVLSRFEVHDLNDASLDGLADRLAEKIQSTVI